MISSLLKDGMDCDNNTLWGAQSNKTNVTMRVVCGRRGSTEGATRLSPTRVT